MRSSCKSKQCRQEECKSFIAQEAKRQTIKVRKFVSSHLITHDADFCAITVASDGFQFANPGYTFFKRLGIAVLFGFPTDFFFFF